MSAEERTMNKSFVTIVATVALFLVINVSMLLRKDSTKIVTVPRIRPPSSTEYRNMLLKKGSLHLRATMNRTNSSSQPPPQQPSSIWLSMAVCFSSDKRPGAFPYILATKLATQLWLAKTPFVKILIQVIYEPRDRGKPELEKYVYELRKIGSHVVKTVESGGKWKSLNGMKKSEMSCGLKAHMQRMFLPLSAQTTIRPDDLVVTTDVDTFVMKSDVFDELKSPENRGKISILQYENTLQYGHTFAMAFISMPHYLWRSLLKVENPEQLVEAYSKQLNIGNYSMYTWSYDQAVLSRIILESGLCAVPLDNELWKISHLAPPRKAIDDSKTCFHGIYKWSDCTKVNPSVMCSQYRFYPDQKEADLQRVFKGIMSGRIEDIWK